ncbi:MAG: phosphoribosylanthranilate isomerase [bacterium]|nr:MAG: phosphoribosylanthranilate isomerase [bacterium]
MTKIKICGITNIEDATLAVNLGADALGFVFYKDSPRYIRKDAAKEIIRELPPFVLSVGVFVNEKEDRVREISADCCLDILQFHGNESPDFCSHFDKKVIKAFSINNRKDLEVIPSYQVSAVLLDNLELASEAKRFTSRVILAGGLNPANVMKAIQAVEPYGVDVSSGVESKPGKKDRVKLEKFIKTVKKAHK